MVAQISQTLQSTALKTYGVRDMLVRHGNLTGKTTVIDCLRVAQINSYGLSEDVATQKHHYQHALLPFTQCWLVCALLSLDLKLLLYLLIYSGKTVGTISVDFFQKYT